ncbi:MAG: tRNA lysidine(34) synthetase TilS [Rhodospirillales bacterium]|nr:tRNA lysidine(34) synthetase TilS [Rhodospirillales bacterium]
MIKPLDNSEMASLMVAMGPFEAAPHIAVAVSGGADSMALVLLAADWVRQRGGKLSALSVDHGLRPGSTAETQQVGQWLGRRGIDHHRLTWSGPKPQSALQATARAARYDLLEQWCRSHRVLHLLLGHHQEDQAETFLLRLGSGSGIDGLAAMAGIVEKPAMRLLRPLLSVPKARLQATLERASQPWLEDPSNENTAFERIRIRKSFGHFAAAGMTAQGLSETAARMARARVALEAGASSLLAGCCSLHPAGYASMGGAVLFSGDDEISLRALSRALLCVGGGDYPPRLKKLERLHEKMKAAFRDDLAGWKGATLAGCRLLPLKNGHFLICREGRALPAPMAVNGSVEVNWDNRFRVRLRGPKSALLQDISLQPLGAGGWAELVGAAPEVRTVKMPAPVRMTLPSLVDGAGVLAVPHLNYLRSGVDKDAPGFALAAFHPRQTLSGTGFLVAH